MIVDPWVLAVLIELVLLSLGAVVWMARRRRPGPLAAAHAPALGGRRPASPPASVRESGGHVEGVDDVEARVSHAPPLSVAPHPPVDDVEARASYAPPLSVAPPPSAASYAPPLSVAPPPSPAAYAPPLSVAPPPSAAWYTPRAAHAPPLSTVPPPPAARSSIDARDSLEPPPLTQRPTLVDEERPRPRPPVDPGADERLRLQDLAADAQTTLACGARDLEVIRVRLSAEADALSQAAATLAKLTASEALPEDLREQLEALSPALGRMSAAVGDSAPDIERLVAGMESLWGSLAVYTCRE